MVRPMRMAYCHMLEDVSIYLQLDKVIVQGLSRSKARLNKSTMQYNN